MQPFCHCAICSFEIKDGCGLYQLHCDCPLGAPACVRCKSMDGQRSSVGATVCRHCSRYNASKCIHAKPLKCCVCLKSGSITNPRQDICNSLQAWRILQRNQHLRRRSAFLPWWLKIGECSPVFTTKIIVEWWRIMYGQLKKRKLFLSFGCDHRWGFCLIRIRREWYNFVATSGIPILAILCLFQGVLPGDFCNCPGADCLFAKCLLCHPTSG